jgi:hypothetical protein
MIHSVADLVFTEELYLIRKTTVVFSQPWNSLSEADKTLFDKILQAVKLTRHDISIIDQPVLDLGGIDPRPRRVIYFGKPVSGLSQFEVLTVDGSSVVLAPSLEQLHNDQQGKGKLWTALRSMFGR